MGGKEKVAGEVSIIGFFIAVLLISIDLNSSLVSHTEPPWSSATPLYSTASHTKSVGLARDRPQLKAHQGCLDVRTPSTCLVTSPINA